LGSGRCKWHGWLNVDLTDSDLNCDLRKLTLPDCHADVAVAIHVIEHFYEWEALPLLIEWKRVLKPGGKMVLELPCMDKLLSYIAECMKENVAPSKSFSWWAFWGDPAHKSVAMCHKWGYTEYCIKTLMEKAGFVDVKFEEPNYHFPQRDMRVIGFKEAA